MPHSTRTNRSFGCRSRMPVKTSVDTISQIEIGAIAMNVSLTPGVGFMNVSRTVLVRRPTVVKPHGRPGLPAGGPGRLEAWVPEGLPPRPAGEGVAVNPLNSNLRAPPEPATAPAEIKRRVVARPISR